MSNAELGAGADGSQPEATDSPEAAQLRSKIAELTTERNRWKEQYINEAKCRDIAATERNTAQRQVDRVRLLGLEFERQAEDAKRRRTHTSSGDLKSRFRHLEIAYREATADIREALECGNGLSVEPQATTVVREMTTGE